jgi:hypothetical protein
MELHFARRYIERPSRSLVQPLDESERHVTYRLPTFARLPIRMRHRTWLSTRARMRWSVRLGLPAVAVATLQLLTPVPTHAAVTVGARADAIVTVSGGWLRENADTWSCSGTVCSVSTSATEFPTDGQICRETIKATAGDSAADSCTATLSATIVPGPFRDNLFCRGALWTGTGQLDFHSDALNTDLKVPVTVTSTEDDATYAGTISLPQGTATVSGKLTPNCVANETTDVTFEGGFLLSGGTGVDPSQPSSIVSFGGPAMASGSVEGDFGFCSSEQDFEATENPQPIKVVLWTAGFSCQGVPTNVSFNGTAGTTETTVEVDPDDTPGDPSIGPPFAASCGGLDSECDGRTGASFLEEAGSTIQMNLAYSAQLTSSDPKVTWTWRGSDPRCTGYGTPDITCLITANYTV